MFDQGNGWGVELSGRYTVPVVTTLIPSYRLRQKMKLRGWVKPELLCSQGAYTLISCLRIFFHFMPRRKGQAPDTVTGLRLCVLVSVQLHTAYVVFSVVSTYELTQTTIWRLRRQWQWQKAPNHLSLSNAGYAPHSRIDVFRRKVSLQKWCVDLMGKCTTNKRHLKKVQRVCILIELFMGIFCSRNTTLRYKIPTGQSLAWTNCSFSFPSLLTYFQNIREQNNGSAVLKTHEKNISSAVNCGVIFLWSVFPV